MNALKEEVETLNKKLAELTEKELEQVVGGHEAEEGITTKMHCSSCPFEYVWVGDFVGRTFECPHCHSMTLTGIELR